MQQLQDQISNYIAQIDLAIEQGNEAEAERLYEELDATCAKLDAMMTK